MSHLLKKISGIVSVLILSFFMTSGSGPEGEISMLVRQRTDIMNDYYSGHILYEEASARIENIENGRLLKEDLSAMKEFFQTDIEEIMDYEIREVTITDMDDTLICAVVNIVWETEGLEGKETIENIYSTIAEKNGNSYKLVQFF